MDGAQKTTRMDQPAERSDGASIGNLLNRLRDETTYLLRQEVALAKAEMSEKASRVARESAYLAAGGLVLYAGVLSLVGALGVLVAWLLVLTEISAWAAVFWGFVMIGVIVAAIGYALVQKAISTLRRETPVPEKTMETLKEDQQWLQNKTG